MTTAHRTFPQRMIAAAMLDITLYEEVEADDSATSQAGAVVAMAAVAQALGGIGGGASHAVGALFAALVGWLVWAGITYIIGDKMLGGTATWGELLRTLGFAQSPGLLMVFAIVPLLGGVAALVIGIWILVAGIIAIRQALDFGTGRAILTAVLGIIPYIVLVYLLGA